MPIIPTKLSRQVVNNKCKGAHKYRRFSKKNKTYKTDCYYCAICGHQVKIIDIFGKLTHCWKCNEVFSVPAGMFSLFPSCLDCRNKGNDKVAMPANATDWLEDNQEQKPIAASKEDILNELMEIVEKKTFTH